LGGAPPKKPSPPPPEGGGGLIFVGFVWFAWRFFFDHGGMIQMRTTLAVHAELPRIFVWSVCLIRAPPSKKPNGGNDGLRRLLLFGEAGSQQRNRHICRGEAGPDHRVAIRTEHGSYWWLPAYAQSHGIDFDPCILFDEEEEARWSVATRRGAAGVKKRYKKTQKTRNASRCIAPRRGSNTRELLDTESSKSPPVFCGVRPAIHARFAHGALVGFFFLSPIR
jgi:hypothetical protein